MDNEDIGPVIAFKRNPDGQPIPNITFTEDLIHINTC